MHQIRNLILPKARSGRWWQHYLNESIVAIAGVSLVTGTIYIFHLYPSIPNISFVNLLLVLALARRFGLYAAVLSAFLAFFSFDFFLVPPLYTLIVSRNEEWLALLLYLVTAIITCQVSMDLRQHAEEASRREREARVLLSSELHQHTEEASRRERETRILYELIQTTNGEKDLESQLNTIARAIVEVFSCYGIRNCAILLPDSHGKLSLCAGASQSTKLSSEEEKVAMHCMMQGKSVELYDGPFFSHNYDNYTRRILWNSTIRINPVRSFIRMVPLRTTQKVIGVLRLYIEDCNDPRLLTVESSLSTEQGLPNSRTEFFWRFLDQVVSVIERSNLQKESLQIESWKRTDNLRASLVSSVSHDLRTPLSSIKIAASSLRQVNAHWSYEAVSNYALEIEEEVDRLDRLVVNLLDMSRIEGGALKPKRELYPIDALMNTVLGHMQALLQGRLIEIKVPEDLPAVELDTVQIDQVLTNLIENAVRYTPPESPIEIFAQVNGKHMLIGVADRGPGIPSIYSELIFDKFYRVERRHHVTYSSGSGLGLAVCRGLVEAHGGRIWASNRNGGGALFQFTLPLEKAEE